MEISTQIGVGFLRPERSSKAPTAEAVLARRQNAQAGIDDVTGKPETAKIAFQPLAGGNNLPQEEASARLSQALSSLQKNIDRNPANVGLENALSRIERNIARYQDSAIDSGANPPAIEILA